MTARQQQSPHNAPLPPLQFWGYDCEEMSQDEVLSLLEQLDFV